MTFKQVILLSAVLMSASVQAEPPGRPVVGPKLVCFKYSTFELAKGESISPISGSPEGISLSVEGPSGRFTIGESEIYASVKGAKRLVHSNASTSVYRVPGKNGRYAIYGPTSFSDGKVRLVIWLSGENLKGKKSDQAVFKRFTVRDPAGVVCEQTFTYSWGFD